VESSNGHDGLLGASASSAALLAQRDPGVTRLRGGCTCMASGAHGDRVEPYRVSGAAARSPPGQAGEQ
jgi:hypothetical protein